MSQHANFNQNEDNASQVSRIIRQMHEDHPSVEKSREVVIDKYGNKKIRIVKKRRVSATVQNRENGNRRWMSVLLITVLLAIVGGAVFFTMRLSSMSGETYQREQEEALRQAWGAESVSLSQPSTENFRLEIGGLTARFPANSLVERVEISGISGMIGFKSYFSGVLSGNLLEIARVRIFLRDTVQQLETPHFKGERLWNFDRIKCKDFQILFADADRAPFALKTTAYLYSPNDRAGSHSLAIDGGTLELRRWPVLHIKQGNILSTYGGLEEINVTGTLDMSASGKAIDGNARVTIRGSILERTSVRGELTVESSNVPLSLLTGGKLERVVTGRTRQTTGADLQAENKDALRMLLPAPGEAGGPEFSGRALLQDIQFSNRNLPAIGYLLRHVESNKREKYAPPTIREGALSIQQKSGYVRVDIRGDDVSDPYVITIQGGVSVDENDQLSGRLDYGLPVILTQAEYPDAKSDPLFIEDGRIAWMRTVLKGTAERPTDNADELEKRAAQERKNRPPAQSLNWPVPTGALPIAPHPPSAPTQPGTGAPSQNGAPPVPAPDHAQEDLFLRTLQPAS